MKILSDVAPRAANFSRRKVSGVQQALLLLHWTPSGSQNQRSISTGAVRESGDGPAHASVKRKVAVHVAYVGTNYKGLQFLGNRAEGTAVEDVMEHAMGLAGVILPSNVNPQRRVGWSRSSRTDKGVHSLSSVVGLKMECKPEEFEADPEGQRLTEAINRHLPPEIKVLSVQRAHKAFNARTQCKNRTYHYYVPATALGLTGHQQQDAAIMKRLQDCLSAFQGTHPFHNYTERRRYSPKAQEKAREKPQRDRWTENADAPLHALGDSGGGNGDDDYREPEKHSDSCESGDSQAASTCADSVNSDVGNKNQGATGRSFRPSFRFQWIEEGQQRDKIGDAHYRHILHASASLPSAEQSSFVVILLQASSFMVYQIRHMVAMAICVALQKLPMQFLQASMHVQSRMSLPIAPAEFLVLQNSVFRPFPSPQDSVNPVVALSGPELTLRQQGFQNREMFAQKALYPALQLLSSENTWAQWMQSLDVDIQYDEEWMHGFLESHEAQKKEQERRTSIGR